MAKKGKTEKQPRELTKRQHTQWQRERQRQRIIFGAGIFIVAAVVLIILTGWYLSAYRPFHQTVIRVNDTKFNTSYYIDTLKIAGKGQEAAYMQSIADVVAKQIEQDEVIRQGAEQLGITATDDEAREKLKGTSLPESKASLDLARVEVLRDKLLKEKFDAQVPKSAAQVHILTMLLESESQAAEIRTRLQGSDNFTALAQQFSLDSYTKSNGGDIGWHPQEVIPALLGTSIPGDYAFGSEAGTLSQPRYDESISKPVGYWLLKVVEKLDGDNAQVQAILLGSLEEGQKVRSRLTAGEDFGAIAQELSQYPKSKDNGGELGEVTKGSMGDAFDAYVFNPSVQTGALSEPVRDDKTQTTGGYWLIQVLEKAGDRALETNDRNYLLARVLDEWVSSLWLDTANYEVDESHLNDELKTWAILQAIKNPLS